MKKTAEEIQEEFEDFLYDKWPLTARDRIHATIKQHKQWGSDASWDTLLDLAVKKEFEAVDKTARKLDLPLSLRAYFHEVLAGIKKELKGKY